MARKQNLLPTVTKSNGHSGSSSNGLAGNYVRLATDPDSDPYSPYYRNKGHNGQANGYANGGAGGSGNLLLNGGSTTFGDQASGASRLMFV